MAKISIKTFKGGVQGDGNYEGATYAIDEMRNLKTDRMGRCVPRLGSANRLITSERSGLVTSLYRARRMDVDAPISTTSPINSLYWLELTSTALQVDVGNASATEIKNSSYSPTESIVPRWREHLFVRGAAFGNRLFLGINSASGASRPIWIDVNAPTVTKAYTVGHAVPTTPTDALVSGGSLSTGSWYGYVYTYYNPTYGIETAPSAVTTANPSGANLTVRLTMTQTVDTQFSQVRIYRTAAQTSSALAESATKSLLTATAMTNGTSTFTYDDDGTGTLGAAQATSDHTVLSVDSDTVLQYLLAWKNILWGVVLPNTVVFSKRTGLTAYPDWFPADNTFRIGDTDDDITGMEVSPRGDGILFFTRKHIYLMTGDTLNAIDLSTRYDEIGCPFPRTIANVNGRIFFLGGDNKVWVTDGGNPVPISRPVNNHLSHIQPSWALVPCATNYFNQYWLAFPSTTKVTTSGTGTTITTPATNLLTAAAPHRITDAAAWNLSAAKIGMWVNQVTVKRRIGIITGVSDASDYIDIEDFRDLNSAGTATPAGSVAYEVFYNDRILLYDVEYNEWQGPHRSMNVNAFSWWQNDSGELYGARSDAGYIDQLNTGTTDLNTAGTATNITALLGVRFVLPEVSTGETNHTINDFNVYQDSPTEMTTAAYKNDASTATETTAAFTPTDSNHGAGFSAVNSAQNVKIELTGTSIGNIHLVELDYT